MRVHEHCSECGKVAEIVQSVDLGPCKLEKLVCSHVRMVPKVSVSDTVDYAHPQGLSPIPVELLPFQVETCEFASKRANLKCLIAHEQGLGKTVIACSLLYWHQTEMLPVLVVTKASLLTQWTREVLRFSSLFAQILASRQAPDSRFPVQVISYDLMGRRAKAERNNPGSDPLFAHPFKSIILDECQQIKNFESSRTRGIMRFINDRPSIKVVGLSGTPIKNNSVEYFPMLNILDAGRFPYFGRFVSQFCDTYYDSYGRQKFGGIRNLRQFQDYTKDIILRYERAEVMPDLPTIQRKFFSVEFPVSLREAYLREFDKFAEVVDHADDALPQDILAYLTRMRHLTGIAKAEEAFNFISDHLENTDRKLVVATHHKDVRTILTMKLAELESLGLGKTMFIDPEQVSDPLPMIDEFKNNPSYRVLILSTLAHGEGLNLQFIEDVLFLEREWNPANEEQFEGRFARIGATHSSVSVTYMTALETIDEFFCELVERKRANMKGTLNAQKLSEEEYQKVKDSWQESEILRELMQEIVKRGRPRWKY